MLTDAIEEKQLLWCCHMRIMGHNRIPQKVWGWKPAKKRVRRRPRKSWHTGITEAKEKREMIVDTFKDKKFRWRDAEDGQGCNKTHVRTHNNGCT